MFVYSKRNRGTLNTGGICALSPSSVDKAVTQGPSRASKPMKCVISRVLCQNACFSKSSHSLTHMYTARTRRGRFGGCTKSEAALWASNPMHLGCKSQFHSLVLPSGPSGGRDSTVQSHAGGSSADPTRARRSLVAAAAGGRPAEGPGREGGVAAEWGS